MTIRVVRITALTVYMWMLGATLTMLGIAFVTLDTQGADLLALGTLFMLAALLAPLFHALYDNVQELRNKRAETNRGDV